MTPVPLELPLQTGEAGKLAEIVFQTVEGHRLRDAVWSRIGNRIAALQLSSIRAFPGSLQRDPTAPRADFLHEAARQFNAILTLDSGALADSELQAPIGRIAGARVNYGIPREPHEIGSIR